MKSSSIVAIFVALAFFVHVQNSVAQTSSTSMAAEGNEAVYEEADRTIEKLFDIKSASFHYYNSLDSFPAAIEELKADGFYFGTYDTTYGTRISGANGGNNYTLTVDVLDETVANYIANNVNGTSAGSVVSMQYGLPSQEAVLDTVLSRVFDGDASRNTMETDLNMGGNSITGVNEVTASAVRATGGVYDNGVRVFSTVNLPNKSHVGLGNVENYGITHSYTNGSANLYASQKAVFDAYTDVNATIDALTKADVGLGNVQNYTASSAYLGGSSTTYATQKAITDSHNFLLNEITTFSKEDVGLGNVQNYGVTNSYTGSSSSLYTTQAAVNSAYLDLVSQIGALTKADVGLGNVQNYGVTNSHTGTATNLYATQRALNNAYKELITNINNLDKTDVGLGNVQNYVISDSYTGGSSTVYASQKAVTDAYNSLNTSKLNKNAKAADANLLDGVDSSQFVRTYRTVNGKSLSSNITLDKYDIALGNLQNYAITNSYTGGSTTLYASQKAVTDAYNALNSSKLGKGESVSDSDKVDGIHGYQFIRSDANDNVTGHIEWQDNYSARFGSAADLRIFHNGNSFIDNHSGNLYLRNRVSGAQIKLESINGSGGMNPGVTVDSAGGNVSATLYYNGAGKLKTTSSGVTVTGDVNTTGVFRVNGRRLDKGDVGLGSVMNYPISDSYTGGSSTVYASQRAVTLAYNQLNSSKLDKNAKAVDSDRLDGLDSTAFVRTSRRINGKALTSDITVTKSDVGLGNVKNYGITDNFTGGRSDLYASQKAVTDAIASVEAPEHSELCWSDSGSSPNSKRVYVSEFECNLDGDDLLMVDIYVVYGGNSLYASILTRWFDDYYDKDGRGPFGTAIVNPGLTFVAYAKDASPSLGLVNSVEINVSGDAKSFVSGYGIKRITRISL